MPFKETHFKGKNLNNNLGSRPADKVKEEGWSSRSSGLMMQSQNQEAAKSTGTESPGIKHGSFIYRQQDLLPTAPAARKTVPSTQTSVPSALGLGSLRTNISSGLIFENHQGSEPTAIWGINNALSTRVWSRERGKALIALQGAKGPHSWSLHETPVTI